MTRNGGSVAFDCARCGARASTVAETLYVCRECHERAPTCDDGATGEPESWINPRIPLGVQIDCGNREGSGACQLTEAVCSRCERIHVIEEFKNIVDALDNPADDALLTLYAIVPHIKALMAVVKAAREVVEADSKVSRRLCDALNRLDKVRA